MVIKYHRQEIKFGGALAVAYLLKNFYDNIFLYTCVGNDYLYSIQKRLNYFDIQHNIIVTTLRTVKTRYVIDDQLQKDRWDFDVNNVVNHSNLDIQPNDIIVIQDYGKGFCNDKLLSTLSNLPNRKIVDPYIGCDWNKYHNPFLIKCNKKEAIFNLKHEDLVENMVRKLAKKHQCHTIITDGKNGMYYYDFENGNTHKINAIKVPVTDICGAGDTVLATIAAGIAYKFSILYSCKAAAITASQQIQTIGINMVKNPFVGA